MVDFSRAQPDAKAPEANAKAGAEVKTPMINYDDATDLGLNANKRAADSAAAARADVSMGQSYVAGAKASVLGGLLKKIDEPDFDPTPGFDVTDHIQQDEETKLLRPDEDELRWLQGSSSTAEYDYRRKQIPAVRKELSDAAMNPVSGMAGMLVADAPSMLIPFVQEGAIGRTAATALRVAADTYDITASIVTADQLGQSQFANGLVAGTGVLDLAHLARRGVARVSMRADRNVDEVAAETEAAAAADGTRGAFHTDESEQATRYSKETGVTPDMGDAAVVEGKANDLVVDPDSPTLPASTRDLDDDIALDANIPARDETPAVDYSALRDINVNTNQASHGKKLMDEKFGKPIVSDIPMRPMMGRVGERLDELAASGKLPEDFPAQYRTLLGAVADNAEDVPVVFDRKANFRSHYHPMTSEFTGQHVRMAFPRAAVGKGKMNAADLIGHMDAHELRTFLHESIHAATSRAIIRAERSPKLVTPGVRQAVKDMDSLRLHLSKQLNREQKAGTVSADEAHYIKYYLSNNHEVVAGLGDSRGGFTKFLQRQTSVSGKESALRKLGKTIMQALGIKGSGRSGLTDVADALEDLLAGGSLGNGKLGKQALNRMAPEYASGAMQDVTKAAREAALKAPAGRKATAAAEAQMTAMKDKLKRFISLRDDIAANNPETAAFADFLVADGTKVGERSESVADYKRLMKSEMDAVTAHVEKSISNELARRGQGKVQQFLYRKDFVTARKELEAELSHYLDFAHGEFRAGREVPPAPSGIKSVVDDYVNSGWAERWHDHMTNAGMDVEGRFVKSPYYLPRRYNADKIRNLSREKGYAQKDYVDFFSAAMRDAYPAMDRDLSRQVARTWYQGLTSAQPAQGAMWRRAVNGMSNDEFVDMLVEHGIDAEEAARILENSVFASERTGSNPARNLRKRNELDMQKEYTAQSGLTMRLADIMDTDVTKLMNQYNNRMSGRAAFAAKGTQDLKDVVNQIDKLRNTVEDPAAWTSHVDDTIDVLLGYPARAETPDWMLATGYLSNATMLKNSGLYQLTDLALSAKEFGLARVMRSMMQSGLFKHVRVELGADKGLNQRLHNILTGATQNDMRFKWLHTYADDNTDLTRSALYTNRLRNLSQAAYSANGMRAIHRAMVNMNSGMIQDSIYAALKGSKKDAELLQKHGMRSAALEEMRAAYAKNPDATFRNDLQMHLESVGQRFMDYVVQQNRTGETAHFAEMNPVGRVLIGYQSFAFAATNKILRRHLENDKTGGAMLLAYQFPMMLLAMKAKAAMDGKDEDMTSGKMIQDAAWGMSALGGLTMLQPLFTESNNTGGVSMFGSVNNMVQTFNKIKSQGTDISVQDASRMLPLVQEFVPLRILINNTSGD